MQRPKEGDRSVLLRRLSLLRDIHTRQQNSLEQQHLMVKLAHLSLEKELVLKYQMNERRKALQECQSARALPPDQSARITNRLHNIRALEMRRSSCPKCRKRQLVALYKEVGLEHL